MRAQLNCPSCGVNVKDENIFKINRCDHCGSMFLSTIIKNGKIDTKIVSIADSKDVIRIFQKQIRLDILALQNDHITFMEALLKENRELLRSGKTKNEIEPILKSKWTPQYREFVNAVMSQEGEFVNNHLVLRGVETNGDTGSIMDKKIKEDLTLNARATFHKILRENPHINDELEKMKQNDFSESELNWVREDAILNTFYSAMKNRN